MTLDDGFDPVVDAGGHPTVETLAALDAELYAPQITAAMRRHTDSCARCQPTLHAYADLRRRLAGLPAPDLPDAVADRLTAALRAESQARETEWIQIGRMPSSGAAPVVSLDDARRRRAHRFRALSAAAAAAVIVAGGVVAGIVASSGGNGPNPVAKQPAAHLPGLTLHSSKPQGPLTPGTGVELPAVRDSTALKQLLPSILSGNLTTNGVSPGIAACASGLLGAGHTPIAVRRITFGSGPNPVAAYVIAFRSATPGMVDAYVVRATCSEAPSRPLARLTVRGSS